MSSVLGALVDEAIKLLQPLASKSTVLVKVGSASVTAGGVEASLGTVLGFYSAFSAAVKAKNYGAEVELGLDEALAVAGDLGVPYAGLGATLLPFLFAAINHGVFTGAGMDGQPGSSALQDDLEDRFESGKSR